MKKRVLVSLMVVVMVFSNVVAFAGNYDEDIKEYRTDETEKQVETLVNMGLIKGNDDGDLLLEDELIRVEGAVVYSRLFGMEQEAYDYENDDSAFADVPGWGARVVNFLYNRGVVRGITQESFGAYDMMTAEQFTTMVLRGMGYSDVEGDFVWNESLDKAVDIGMITEEVKSRIEKENSFTREEMMIISYNALFTPAKSGKLVLQERQQLFENSVMGIITLELTEQEIEEIYKLEYGSSNKPFDKDAKRQEELFEKFIVYIQKMYDLASVTIDGEPVEFEVEGIINITKGRDQGIYVTLYTGGELKLRNNENVVYMGQDASFLSHLSSVAIQYLKRENLENVSGALNTLEGTSEDSTRNIKITKGGQTLFDAIIYYDHNNLSMDIVSK